MTIGRGLLRFGFGGRGGWGSCYAGIFPLLSGVLRWGLLAGCFPYFEYDGSGPARIAAFEAQFPDALEFLSRSMRAGHGFTTGMNLLVEESPEPLAGVSSDGVERDAAGGSARPGAGKVRRSRFL